MTVKYLQKKSSACVEAFRTISCLVAHAFGDADHSQRHKEVQFYKDIEALVDDLVANKIHKLDGSRVVVPREEKGWKVRDKGGQLRGSAVVDIILAGEALLKGGKMREYMDVTMFDPKHGAVLGTDMETNKNAEANQTKDVSASDGPRIMESYIYEVELEDVDDGKDGESRILGLGGLGGGETEF